MRFTFNGIVIVRKIGEELKSPVADVADLIKTYGHSRKIPVYDWFNGDIVPEDKSLRLLFVSLGGDGTFLFTSNLSVTYEKSSIVGFNMGNVGFLTEDFNVNGEIIGFLDSIAHDTDEVKTDKRLMLQATINGNRFFALNEIALSSSLQSFIKTDVYINSDKVTTYGGNGVAVTTATGSTGLGLSAGGAIINPKTSVLQIVPLLSHSVAKQPIITSGYDVVVLQAKRSSRVEGMFVVADGRKIWSFDEQAEVIIQAPKYVALWRPKDWNFFEVLSKKMEWH